MPFPLETTILEEEAEKVSNLRKNGSKLWINLRKLKRILMESGLSHVFTYRRGGPFAKDLPSNPATKVSFVSCHGAV